MTPPHHMHVPVSPADSSTEIPLNPSWPIMLQTRMAYFSGTVCTLVLLIGEMNQHRATYLFVVSIGIADNIR